MGADGKRAVHCLEKDLDSLFSFFRFDPQYWAALRTTNSIETINRQFKRRAKTMDSLGEETLEVLVAFTALKIEMGWRKHPLQSKAFQLGALPPEEIINEIEKTVAHLNVVR